jgi:putative DNA primase/helicase
MDWITSKEWDGRAHIDCLIDTVETPPDFPDDIKTIIIRKWMISAVAAASMKTGFACRGVLVFQGRQSKGKTSWFRRLVPSDSGWFGEGKILDPSDKDLLKIFVSHWIVELGELEGTFKKADLARLKAFITNNRDQVRMPWARKVSEFPRRTVMCASVNQKEVLMDSTGNTRWWVVPTVKIDYTHDIDMQQAWAEAYRLFKSGETWWLTPEEEERLEEQNGRFEAPDAVEDMIATTFDWECPMIYPVRLTVTEVLKKCGIQNPMRGQLVKAGEVLRKFTGREPVYEGPSHARRKVFEMPDKKIGQI